jgi:hypothetical protein
MTQTHTTDGSALAGAGSERPSEIPYPAALEGLPTPVAGGALSAASGMTLYPGFAAGG